VSSPAERLGELVRAEQGGEEKIRGRVRQRRPVEPLEDELINGVGAFGVHLTSIEDWTTWLP
jgi:hypothetical protein